MLVLALLAALPVWLSWPGNDPGAQVVPVDPPGRAIAAVPATAGDVGVAPATRAVVTGEALPAPPPIPTDARWIEVTVVDAATQVPVPEAEVAYLNRTAREVADDTVLPHAEQVRCREDDEVFALRFGWRTRADARGVARVHLGEWTTVFARAGERLGKKHLEPHDPAPPEGHRIELRPDRTLRVRVVDSAGAPVVGAEVILETFDALGADGDHRDTRETLAPDGIAVVAHTQDLRRQEHDAQDGITSGWRVRLELFGVELPGVTFDPQAPPAEPVTLAMPGQGRIRVGTVAFGQPVTGHGPGLQWFLRGGHHTVSVCGVRDGPGFALFSPVALHQTFVATACGGAVKRQFAGPKAPGELVEVVLEPDADSVFVRGSVLATDGRPLTDAFVGCSLSGAVRDDDRSLQTDGAGRFLLWVGARAAAEHVHMRLQQRTAEGPLAATAGPLPMTSGVHDVGNLLLRPLPLVVSGVCIEGGRECDQVGWLHIQGWQAGTWQRCEDLFERCDGARFAVHGTVAPGRLRLRCLREGARSPWVEFEAGATDLVVPMTSDGVLAANVQLPASAPGAVRALVFREPDPNAPRDAAATLLEEDHLESADGERVVRRWHVPQPGTYALEFRLWSDEEPLLRIAGIELPAPAGGDPRLAAIDLRDLVEQLTLEPRDATGARLPEPEVIRVLPFGRPAAADWPRFDGYGVTATTLVRRGGADLWVAVSGFRPQVVRGARGHVTVPLAPWPEVELRIEVPASLPGGTTVFARLVPVDTTSVEHPELATCPDWGHAIVDGRARLPIGDGPHQVMVGLTRGNRSETIAIDGPASVLASPVPVAIRIQQASWQEALAKLATKQ